jgi:hypothetical protein
MPMRSDFVMFVPISAVLDRYANIYTSHLIECMHSVPRDGLRTHRRAVVHGVHRRLPYNPKNPERRVWT